MPFTKTQKKAILHGSFQMMLITIWIVPVYLIWSVVNTFVMTWQMITMYDEKQWKGDL